jgi:hypothetical protein
MSSVRHSEEARRERRLRRLADRHGLLLRKSRSDGSFMLVDRDLNCVVMGHRQGYGYWLDAIEVELRTY